MSIAGLNIGCGSSFSEILFQAASAVGRSALDGGLTNLANDFADRADEQVVDTGDGGDMADDVPDTPVDVPGGGGDLVGDPAAGESLFTANGCTSCHCDDASGGCALSAPRIVGVAIEEITARLTGDVFHPIKVDLTAVDLADLQAFLASLGG